MQNQFHYYWDAGSKMGLITAPNTISTYTIKPIALHMLVYGTSHGFSLNEGTRFLFFFKLYFYFRTNIFR
jgi:hypothetical protein